MVPVQRAGASGGPRPSAAGRAAGKAGRSRQVVGLLVPSSRPNNPPGCTTFRRTCGRKESAGTCDALVGGRPGGGRGQSAVDAGGRAAAVGGRAAGGAADRGRPRGGGGNDFGRHDMLDFDAGQTDGEDLRHAFLATGTVHYMAVSGFNVAMVVWPVLALLRLLGAGRRVTAVVVALVVLVFLMMTELEPPVLRASILFWVLCAGWLLGRETSAANSLATAVIGVLAVRPGDIFSLSFQLSFLAVLGMMLVVGRMERACRPGL